MIFSVEHKSNLATLLVFGSILLASCNERKAKKLVHEPINLTSEQWVDTIKSLSRSKIDNADFRSDTLELMGEYMYNFPGFHFHNEKNMEYIISRFHSITYGAKFNFKGINCIKIYNSHKSSVYFSEKLGVIGYDIRDSSCKLFNKIFIGMKKKDFVLGFLKTYPRSFDQVNTISFYYGMGNNIAYFNFKNNRLVVMSMIDVPD